MPAWTTPAVTRLLGALQEAGASDAVTVLLARDLAANTVLDYPKGVARLLDALQETEARDAAE